MTNQLEIRINRTIPSETGLVSDIIDGLIDIVDPLGYTYSSYTEEDGCTIITFQEPIYHG